MKSPHSTDWKLNRVTTMKSTFKQSVFGLAFSPLHAGRIVNHLFNAGFLREDISVLQPEPGGESGVEEDSQGALAWGRKAEAGLGLPDAWPAGTETLAHPRFDQFMAGGPIRGELCVATVASASRGAVENDQHRIAGRQWLICLQSNDWREAEAARKIFQALGASNISLGGEKASRLLVQSFQRFEAGLELQPV